MVPFGEIKTLNLALKRGQMWSGTLKTPLNELKMTSTLRFGKH